VTNAHATMKLLIDKLHYYIFICIVLLPLLAYISGINDGHPSSCWFGHVTLPVRKFAPNFSLIGK